MAEIHYPENFLDRLELIWGQGFMSPGGSAEVMEIVEGIALRDRRLLDIGSGLGGPAVTLARLGALVTGIDVEPQLFERARRHLEQAGVADRIELRHVEPGDLPFGDGAFDVVFSKDALVHVEDKEAIYAEMHRVTCLGGHLAVSDWLGGEGAGEMASYRRYAELAELDFRLATAAEIEAAAESAGYVDIEIIDRHDWYVHLARQEAETIAGPLRKEAEGLIDEATYERWIDVRFALAEAVEDGAIRPTHIRAERLNG